MMAGKKEEVYLCSLDVDTHRPLGWTRAFRAPLQDDSAWKYEPHQLWFAEIGFISCACFWPE